MNRTADEIEQYRRFFGHAPLDDKQQRKQWAAETKAIHSLNGWLKEQIVLMEELLNRSPLRKQP